MEDKLKAADKKGTSTKINKKQLQTRKREKKKGKIIQYRKNKNKAHLCLQNGEELWPPNYWLL